MTPLEKRQFEIGIMLDWTKKMIAHMASPGALEKKSPPSDQQTKFILCCLVSDLIERQQEKLRNLIKNP